MAKKKKESKVMRMRTVSAREAVKRYPAYNKFHLEGSIVDLITDCLHYANLSGVDTDRLLRTVLTHYDAEKIDEQTL